MWILYKLDKMKLEKIKTQVPIYDKYQHVYLWANYFGVVLINYHVKAVQSSAFWVYGYKPLITFYTVTDNCPLLTENYLFILITVNR